MCAGSPALDHPSDAVRAGYNLYEIDFEGRIVRAEAYVLDPGASAPRPVGLTES